MENPYLDSPNVDYPTQINTNIINIKEQIDKDDKRKSSFFVAEEHNHLTLNLLHQGYINEDDLQIFYYDKMYEAFLNEGNSYKDLLIISDYIINKVKHNKFKDEDSNIIRNKFGYLKESINSNIKKLNMEIDDLWEVNDDLII